MHFIPQTFHHQPRGQINTTRALLVPGEVLFPLDCLENIASFGINSIIIFDA